MEKSELTEEDLERVRKVTSTGIHSVERKPFRPFFLMLVLLGVLTGVSLLSLLIARLFLGG